MAHDPHHIRTHHERAAIAATTYATPTAVAHAPVKALAPDAFAAIVLDATSTVSLTASGSVIGGDVSADATYPPAVDEGGYVVGTEG